MRIFHTLFFLTSLTLSGLAQNDYIATYDWKKGGVKIQKGTAGENSVFIRVSFQGKITKYSCDDISEYGLETGEVFVAKDVVLDGVKHRFFLEVLHRGKIDLYYLKNRKMEFFFVQKGVQWEVINTANKNELFEKLKLLTADCEQSTAAIDHIDLNKKSVAKFLVSYEKCEEANIYRTRIGASIRLGGSSLKHSQGMVNDAVNNVTFESNVLFNVGVFLDKPIASTNFSFNTGLYFSSYKMNERFSYFDSLVNVNISLFAVDVPIQVRYYLPLLKARPFVNGGAILSYHLKNDSYTFPGYNYVEDLMIGYTIGMGVQINSQGKHAVSFELRHNRMFGPPENVIKRQTEFVISVSF